MSDANIEKQILERLIRIETRLESLTSARDKTYENEKKIISLEHVTEQQAKDIKDLQERNKWLTRTTIAAVIGTAISAVGATIMALLNSSPM